MTHAQKIGTSLTVVLLVLLGLAGCPGPPAPAPQPSPPVAPSAAPAADAGADKADAAAVPGRIATCGEIVLKLEDYEAALDHMRVYRPIAGDVLGSPRFQQGTVINLVDIRLMRAAAHERGLSATPEEVATVIGADARLAAAPVEKARVVAADSILNRKLTAALAPPATDEELWAAWKAQAERVEIEFVAVPNTPSSSSITSFTTSHAAEIEAHFSANSDKFRLPPTRRVRILEMTGPKAREALLAHRIDVLGGADFGAIARKASVHPTAKTGGDMGWVVQRQRPEAFAVKVGEVTQPFRTRTGQAIVQVREALPARPVTLTGAVRREIAADLLRSKGPDAQAHSDAVALASAWASGTDKLDVALKKAGLRKQGSLPFRDDGDAQTLFVPGIGRAPQVVLAVRKLTEPGQIAGPVFARGHHYVLRLLRRGEATRTGFAAERDAFRKSFDERRRRSAVPSLLEQRRTDCGLEMDLTPIVARYGRTQKPGH